MKRIQIDDGAVVTFDVMEWYEPGWEFAHPGCILRPIFREYEDGSSIDQMLEDICITATIDGELTGEFDPDWGWSKATLNRNFKAALAGKRFPEKQVRAKRVTVQFHKDAKGDLIWTELPEGSRQ